MTGKNPLFFAAADFDKDGDMDLAVTNSDYIAGGTNAGVAVLKNDGTGIFASLDFYPAGRNLHGITTGDFNEDGILDLAVAGKNSSDITILRGQGAGGVGNGTFAPGGTLSPGGAPFQIVTGDYDRDGILDLATVLNDRACVVILPGLGSGGVGNGTFGPAIERPIASVSTGIEQGDFTGDGVLDLVATENYAGTIAVLRGLGTPGFPGGGFAPAVHYAAGTEPFDLHAFDFDEDGIRDLAVANSALGGTRILHGGGSGGVADGTFTPGMFLPTGTTSSVIAFDVNEDGIQDLVAAESVLPIGRRLHLYFGGGAGGVGDGSFVAAGPISVPSFPYQLVAEDFTGDGAVDLGVSEYQGDRIEILRGGCGDLLPDPRAPTLTDVRDVPADEGGRVYLTWTRSAFDVTGGVVQSYRVWRRIPASASGVETAALGAALGFERMERLESAPDGRLQMTYWENLATLPAERLAGYGYTAATTEDSTAERPVSTAFFITAATANIDVFYSSNVDSGASVDNLAPQSPSNLRVVENATDRTLVWAANHEPDVEAYRLERAPSSAFAPGEVVVLSTGPDTAFVEAGFVGEASYRVVALDRSRNESAPSAVLTLGAVGVDGAVARLALAGTRPHPAHGGSLRIAFSLASDAPARLDLFDVGGRRVASPSLDGFGPGDHVVPLDRTRVLAPGVYWARLVQGSARVEGRIVVID